jgi:hypothetical protein
MNRLASIAGTFGALGMVGVLAESCQPSSDRARQESAAQAVVVDDDMAPPSLVDAGPGLDAGLADGAGCGTESRAAVVWSRVFTSSSQGNVPEVRDLLPGPGGDLWMAGTFAAPLQLDDQGGCDPDQATILTSLRCFAA